MTIEITSKENKHFKELKQSIKENNYVVIEGKKLFEEAIKSSLEIKKVFTDKKNAFSPKNKNYEIFYIKNDLLSSCFTTSSKPSREDLILALAEKPVWQIKDLFGQKKDLIFLEDIQDPGNLGSIFRSALAFNIGGIFLSKNSVNPFNTKVIRSSAGAVFKVPFVAMEDLKKLAKKHDYEIVATSIHEGEVPGPRLQPNIFLFGNEGHGLSKEVLKLSDKTIKIPHTDEVESLNLGVAVSIVLWERYKK